MSSLYRYIVDLHDKIYLYKDVLKSSNFSFYDDLYAQFMLIYDQFIMMLDDKSFRKCVCVFAPLKQDQKSI